MISVVFLELPAEVRCACALPYVILLKLVGRGCVAGLEVLWKSRFFDECHLAFCCAADSPLNRLVALLLKSGALSCIRSVWKGPSFF